MIHGAHVLLYSHAAEADRAFFRDVLGFRSVDAGHGWLIFALPPAEVAVHPADGESSKAGDEVPASLYLMCEDLKAEIKSLAEKKVVCGPVSDVSWGSRTTIQLPSGGVIGLYQPKHPTALALA
ncbi:MAG: extradiol dioxygenase [Acidobacteriales bacterium]|nr:extradiol dioxygenase [Terriglobales bacterium]